MAADTKTRLGAAVKDYLRGQEARRRSPATIRVDKAILERMVREIGDMTVSRLTPDHLENWFYGPGGIMDTHRTWQYGRTHNPPVQPSTHNQYRSRVKVFFAWCTKRGMIRCDLLEHVEPMKVSPRIRQRPSPRLLLEMLDQADQPRDRGWIAVSLNTALRANEIKRLQVKDVDLENMILHTVITKTKEFDEVPITGDLLGELRRWMFQYAADLGRPLEHDDYLFPRREGGQISHYEVDENGDRIMVRHPYTWVPKEALGRTEKIIQKVLGKMGLPTYYEGTHTIRRAVALAYFENASQEQGDVAALRETAALLHHSTLATTERYLGKTAEKNRRDKRMKGQAFLSAMVAAEMTDNVVSLKLENEA